ncbi:MAG TPA: hypothetical protein VMH80_14565 [Bryobacteraceae bacterium]|nr:hypothetical protein [Bryobacteraceae bacterium]
MKGYLWVISAAALFTVGFATSALADTSLELVDPNNGSTLYVSDNGAIVCTGADACPGIPTDENSVAGAITLAGITYDGYSITVTTGGSNTPLCAGMNGPGCLNTTNITATNISSGTATLDMYFASTGFNPPGVTGLIVGFSTPGETGLTGTQQAYATSGAVNPLGSGVTNPTTGLSVCGPLLTLTGPTGNSSTGATCPAPGAPYSLELATSFTTGVGGAFNLNGTISAVPEPVSITLFGTLLFGLAAMGRYRMRRNKA